MVFRYTNRQGRHYYLHERLTKTGKTRYVFARTVGDGALDDIPKGFEVRENVNGIVSLAKSSTRKKSTRVTDLEEQAVRTAMAALSLDEYRMEARDNVITIFEPDRHRSDGSAIFFDFAALMPPPLPSKRWIKKVKFEPVLRFLLDDHQDRVFYVERMTYRGRGGWSYPLDRGKIVDLAREYLPHLGRRSFFDLF